MAARGAWKKKARVAARGTWKKKAKVAARGKWKKKARELSQCGFGAEPCDESVSFEREESQCGFDAAPCDECPKDHVRRVLVGFGLVELRSLYKLNIEELFLRI